MVGRYCLSLLVGINHQFQQHWSISTNCLTFDLGIGKWKLAPSIYWIPLMNHTSYWDILCIKYAFPGGVITLSTFIIGQSSWICPPVILWMQLRSKIWSGRCEKEPSRKADFIGEPPTPMFFARDFVVVALNVLRSPFAITHSREKEREKERVATRPQGFLSRPMCPA